MKIDCISDTHNCLAISELKFSDAEMLIIAGDVSGVSLAWETYATFEDIDKVPHKHIVFVPGNHDGFFEERIDFPDLFPDTRAHILIDEIIEIGGVRIGGSPWTPEFCGWHFMKDDDDLVENWEYFKDRGLDILVTHGPAYGILDDNGSDNRCGSLTLLNALPEISPKFHIFGHIHGSHGACIEDGIEFRNVSIVNEDYVKAKFVTTIEV